MSSESGKTSQEPSEAEDVSQKPSEGGENCSFGPSTWWYASARGDHTRRVKKMVLIWVIGLMLVIVI